MSTTGEAEPQILVAKTIINGLIAGSPDTRIDVQIHVQGIDNPILIDPDGEVTLLPGWEDLAPAIKLDLQTLHNVTGVDARLKTAPEEIDLETPEGVQALFKQRLERWLDQQPDAVFTGYSLDGGWRVQLAGIGEIELQIKTVI